MLITHKKYSLIKIKLNPSNTYGCMHNKTQFKEQSRMHNYISYAKTKTIDKENMIRKKKIKNRPVSYIHETNTKILARLNQKNLSTPLQPYNCRQSLYRELAASE